MVAGWWKLKFNWLQGNHKRSKRCPETLGHDGARTTILCLLFASLHLSSPSIQTGCLHMTKIVVADSSRGPYLTILPPKIAWIPFFSSSLKHPREESWLVQIESCTTLRLSTGVKGLRGYGFWPQLQIKDLREEEEQCPKWGGLYCRER